MMIADIPFTDFENSDNQTSEISGRIALKGMSPVPAVGKNFDLVLFDGGKILSVFGGCRGIAPLSPLSSLGLAENGEDELSRFLGQADSVLEIPLTGSRGHLLAFGLPGFPGRGIGILPYMSGASVERVFAYVFSNYIRQKELASKLSSNLQEIDCATYELIKSIMTMWQMMLFPNNRFPLYQRIMLAEERIHFLLGLPYFPVELTGTSEMDVLYKISPSARPEASVFFSQLCMMVGLYRCFPKTYQKAKITLTRDGFMTMKYQAGNRTHIPPEWEAAVRMAEQSNFCFTVTRRRDGFTVEYSPAPRSAFLPIFQLNSLL